MATRLDKKIQNDVSNPSRKRGRKQRKKTATK